MSYTECIIIATDILKQGCQFQLLFLTFVIF